jgi:hypothetical protein
MRRGTTLMRSMAHCWLSALPQVSIANSFFGSSGWAARQNISPAPAVRSLS